MKKIIKNKGASDTTDSFAAVELLIKQAAEEFGLSEKEVRICATNFFIQHKELYPEAKKGVPIY